MGKRPLLRPRHCRATLSCTTGTEINASPLSDSDTVIKLFVAAGIAQLRRKGLRYLLAADHDPWHAQRATYRRPFMVILNVNQARQYDGTRKNKPPSPLGSTSCHAYHRRKSLGRFPLNPLGLSSNGWE